MNKSFELLKWLALFSMLGDHINKYLFNGTLPYLFEIGRIAFPIFAFVIAFNLSRENAVTSGALKRTCIRLFIFACISSIPFVLLGGVKFGWWPLNILWLFFFASVCIYLLEHKGKLSYLMAFLAFIAGAALCEYWIFGMALCLSVWAYFKTKNTVFIASGLIALMSLQYVNQNHWALLSVPIILIFMKLNIRMPRMKYIFYVFYPLHLSALLIVRIPMAKAGYLFFM